MSRGVDGRSMRTAGAAVLLVLVLAPLALAPMVTTRPPDILTPAVPAGDTSTEGQGVLSSAFFADHEPEERGNDGDPAFVIHLHASADGDSVAGPAASFLGDAEAPDEAASLPAFESTTEHALANLVAGAHASLAALGAAAQYDASSRHLAGVVGATVEPAETVAAWVGAHPPAVWLQAAFWSVFLASIGLVIARRCVVLLGWGLYARLRAHDVEEHPRRAVILHAIRKDPGVHLAAMERRTGVRAGALRHHLHQLERHGLVRNVRHGRSTHYFPRGGRAEVTAVVPPGARRVLRELGQTGGLTTAELARRLGVRPQTAWEQARRLTEAGLVIASRHGRAMRWTPAPTEGTV